MRLLLAAVLVGAACGGTGPAFQPSEVQIVVEMNDYAVTPNLRSIAAGVTKVGVRNRGPQAHDLVILRTDLEPHKLPYDAARAKAGEPGLVARSTELRSGGTALLTVTLQPGRYVLICNVAGHYSFGMRTSLRVD